MSDHGVEPVKAALTTAPRKSNVEFAGFVRRVVRAHARRIAAGDVEALADLVQLSAGVDQAVADAVAGLRRLGYSWAEIAGRLGISKQAAQQRWGGRS